MSNVIMNKFPTRYHISRFPFTFKPNGLFAIRIQMTAGAHPQLLFKSLTSLFPVKSTRSVIQIVLDRSVLNERFVARIPGDIQKIQSL